jgi:hypothetical protein
MDTRIVGEGSQYMAAFVDSNGDALDGGKNYKLQYTFRYCRGCLDSEMTRDEFPEVLKAFATDSR